MFRDTLKFLRKKAGLTQEELAKIIGVERSSIGKYEGKDGIIPSDPIKEKLAECFGVSIDYLLGRSDVRNLSVSAPLAVPTAPALSPDEARLLDLFRALNAQGRQMAVTTLESFAANPALTQDTTSARMV